MVRARAFSGKVDTGFPKENATSIESRALSATRMAMEYVALYHSLLKRPATSESEAAVALPPPVSEKHSNGHGP